MSKRSRIDRPYVLSRRAMLRGLGVSMALPWLESVRVWGDEPAGRGASSQPPLRFACLFSGNGFHSKEWWARGAGRDMELGKVLEPLEAHREKLLFIRGLYNEEAQKGNIHSSQTGNLLSGAPLASGGAIRSGTSIDQVLAQRIGDQTKVPSLVLACEPSMASVHKNYSMIYSSHISWSSPTSPTPLELYPALAFDRLFKDDLQQGDKSVLDAVLDDASSLRGEISRSDRLKLDEYLNSVREVEQRIERAGKAQQLQGWRPTLAAAEHQAAGRRRSAGHRRAHAADVRHPRAGVPDRHDPILHAQAEQRPLVAAVPQPRRRLHDPPPALAHRLGRLAQGEPVLPGAGRLRGPKLDAIQEGERTALDSSIIMYCSSMLTGSHDATQLPVVILGRGGGQLQTGRTLDYLGKPNRKMCSLFLSLMDKFGVRLDRVRRLARAARGDLNRAEPTRASSSAPPSCPLPKA